MPPKSQVRHIVRTEEHVLISELPEQRASSIPFPATITDEAIVADSLPPTQSALERIRASEMENAVLEVFTHKTESLSERIKRIHREIHEITEFVESDKHDQSIADEVRAVAGSFSELMDRLLKGRPRGMKSSVSGSSSNPQPRAQIAGLEARLAKMEQMVGSGSSAHESLSASVSRMHKIYLLMAESRRLETHLAKMREVATLASQSSATKDGAQLLKAMETLRKIEGAAVAVPDILERLRSLDSVHKEMGGLVDRVRILEEEERDLRSCIDIGGDQVKTLLHRLEEVSINVQGHLKRIEALKTA
eukprot:ANDGO_03346.mRNA.1 hypothetical protein